MTRLGAKGIEELRAKARALGITMTGDSAKAAAKLRIRAAEGGTVFLDRSSS